MIPSDFTVMVPVSPPVVAAVVVVVFGVVVGMLSAGIERAESVYTVTKLVDVYADAPFPKS